MVIASYKIFLGWPCLTCIRKRQRNMAEVEHTNRIVLLSHGLGKRIALGSDFFLQEGNPFIIPEQMQNKVSLVPLTLI